MIDNPILKYWCNGQIKYEEWKYVSVASCSYIYHRLDGPAFTAWYYDGQVSIESWEINGVPTRIGGPAIIRWYRNGQREIEEWRGGAEYLYTRLTGPAITEWQYNGQVDHKQWYYNGIKFEEENHPFTRFCKEHKLGLYENWPEDMKILFKVIYT